MGPESNQFQERHGLLSIECSYRTFPHWCLSKVWVSTFADRDEAVGKQREEHVDKVQRSPAVMPPGVLGSWKAGAVRGGESGGEVERAAGTESCHLWVTPTTAEGRPPTGVDASNRAGCSQHSLPGALSVSMMAEKYHAHHSQRCVFRPWITMRPFLFQGEVLSHTLPFT